MRTLIKLVRAVLAGAALLALLVGIPAALWLFGVRPPSSLPTWDELRLLLGTTDTGGVFLALLTVVGWVAWAGFALAVITEVRSLGSGRPARRLRGLGPAQQLAAILLGAIVSSAAAGPPLAAAGADDSLPASEEGITAVQVVSGEDGTAEDRNLTVPREQQQVPTYTVKPGDSLWRIAEEFLGDGNRWTEIADLNYDRVQPDGRQLDRDDRWLHPGWELVLPDQVAERLSAGDVADAEQAADAVEASGSGVAFTHIVKPGETLQDIAQMHLGDAGRFTEVFEANREVVQADGETLRDPDVIKPGWRIEFTTAHTDHVQRTELEEISPSAPDAVPAGIDDRAPVPDVAAPAIDRALERAPGESTEHSLPSADSEDETQSPWTVWGGGGMLAAGLISAVSMRRSLASRRREPGQRLSMPSGSAALLEAELRYVADADGVAMVDASMRELGQWCTDNGHALPSVAAARTHNGAVRLYLDGPAQLPPPWTASHGNTVWSRPPRDQAPQSQVAPSQVVAGAPYPCLVTVGRDHRGTSVHIDVEHVGMVSIDGTMSLAMSALRALVVELATNPWTEGAQINLIGCFSELAHAIDTGRLRHVESLERVYRPLTRSAATTRDLLAGAAMDSPKTARGRGVAKDAWDPQVVVVGTPLSREESDWLLALCQDPASGVVAVGLGLEQANWTLRVDDADQAHLRPAGLTLRPQLLDETNYRAVLDVLSRAGQTVQGPDWAANLSQDEPLLNTLPTPDGAASAEVRPLAEVIELRPPTIRVLGPVVLDADSTGPLRPSHEAQALEILTYLALHRGVDGPMLSEAIWPGAEPNTSTRNSAVSRARTWLGEDAAGDPYLRRVADDGLYELHGVSTDWGHFTALVRPGLAKTPLPELMSALSLVRGAPFDRSRPGRYRLRAARYAWAEFLAQEMIASIADVAYAASTRALQQAATREALAAARTGLKVAPWEERLWRCAIRAMWAMSDLDGIRQAVSELDVQLALLEAEPEDDTRDLLDEIAMRLDGQVALEVRRATS